MDKPIDILGSVGSGKPKRERMGDDTDTGKVVNLGLRLARDAKRMVIGKAEAEYPDSLAHQCTAAMVAAIIQYRSEEHAAMLAPEDSAPRRVWNAMNALLVNENLGFASKEEADAMDADSDE